MGDVTDNPQDGLRIGTTEREEAVRLLRQQADAGRLDTEELAARADRARAARTRADLQPIFADLPVDLPAVEAATFAPYPGSSPYGPTVDEHAQLQPLAQPSGAPVPVSDDRQETSPTTKRIGGMVIALLWPAAILLNIVFGWNLWWLFLIPIFATGWIGYAFGLWSRPDGHHDERDRRRELRDERRRDRDERRHGWHD